MHRGTKVVLETTDSSQADALEVFDTASWAALDVALSSISLGKVSGMNNHDVTGLQEEPQYEKLTLK